MRTSKTDSPAGEPSTFTQSARQTQLVGLTIDALVEVGYQQTTVAEVARRAGVSKGVVTYHFPARDDLLWAVVAECFSSITTHVGSQLEAAPPETFVVTYLDAWIDYYRHHRREMSALVEVWTNFRDPTGRPHLDTRTLGHEQGLVESALVAGQAAGRLTSFSPRVLAVTLKAALDGLLGQLAIDPDLDLDAYRDELVSLFERATTVAARLPSRRAPTTAAPISTTKEKKR